MGRGNLPEALGDAWETLRPLRTGGQSAPLLIRRRSDRLVAVFKSAKPGASSVDVARMRREIDILRSISHPNVIPVLAYDNGPAPWIVIPYGDPLTEYWRRYRGSHDVEEQFTEACRIVREILSGLVQFHESGGVHRDVKTENVVLLELDGVLRPALIDFGVAHRADDPHLTPEGGRLVANRIAAPPAAYYERLENPPLWWDCLNAAWLWGRLLSPEHEPKDYRFDWRYHPLLEHPQTGRVRAILAQCSDETTAPHDARAMLGLIDRLGVCESGGAASIPNDFAEAREAQSAADAARIVDEARRRGRALAASVALGAACEAMRNEVAKLVADAAGTGLPVVEGSHVDRGTRGVPVVDLLLLAAAKPELVSAPIFSITCGVIERKRFFIYLEGYYRDNVPAGVLPFELQLRLRHDMGDFPHEDISYLRRTDGRVLRRVGGASEEHEVGSNDVAATVARWLQSPTLWSHT